MAHPVFSLPNHLSIFVTDPETGNPVQRLPIYAEVAVPRIIPTPPIDELFREIVYSTAMNIDPDLKSATAFRIASAAWEALYSTIDVASRDQLLSDPDQVQELFGQVFRHALDSSGQTSLEYIPNADLKPQFIAALRHLAPGYGLQLTDETENMEVVWAEPLGVLTTDHVGYVSYDLRRLRTEVQVALAGAIEKRRGDADAELNIRIWVYLYGNPTKFDVLQQARFATDAVVARLTMIWHTLPPGLINMGPMALQNPSLTDWRLSPASFAASPKSLLGADGCEELLPANLALHEFVLRQVVRLTDVPPDFGVPAGFKAAYVDDYKVSWFSLGHSLGEILYSLPLAPGETVKLAVIDWSWDSLTKRDETTKLTEDILHQTHRDRTITETVKAGLKELQQGSSFMGGMANAVGGSGGANLGVVGLGAAVGNTWSLGGSTATSSGSRDLVAENVQRVNDSFAQASSSQREINSTVVVQARQEEKESIQTRTFSNYNHSHTLTILYYEVLRHYRVTVEWVRRRQSILIARPVWDLTDEIMLLNKRFILQPAMLDTSLAPAFDALLRADKVRKERTRNPPVQVVPFDEANIIFTQIRCHFKVGGGVEDSTSNALGMQVLLKNGQTIVLTTGNSANFNRDEAFDDSGATFTIASDPVTIRWGDIAQFKFVKTSGDNEVVLNEIKIEGASGQGLRWLHHHVPGARYSLEDAGDPTDNNVPLAVEPSPPPPPAPPVPTLEQALALDDYALIQRLKEHLVSEAGYYKRLLDLAMHADTYATKFENETWSGSTKLIDAVVPTPLEVLGSYVAYPLAKQKSDINDLAAALSGNDPVRRQWADDKLAGMSEDDRQAVLELTSSKSERLITLPTRGVFAEGKLGHCNISEEIDNTRFWKWDEHPIPIQAPDINPITAITPQPQQVTATPTPFPQSLVNIVNPSAAPDPTGLASALSLLGTPNIFRDMSGRQEVADLLKKLSDNSISIAEAANKAQEIQAKYGTDLDKNQKELEAKTVEANTQAQIAQTNAQAKKTAAEAQKAQSDAKKAELETDLAKLQAAKEYFPPAEQKPLQKETAKKWAAQAQNTVLVIQFRHGLGKQVLDGEFDIIVDGPTLEMERISTSGGTARVSLSKLAPGEYGITIQGRRTKLPNLQGAVVTVPKIGNKESFQVTLNRYIALQGLELSGNGKFKVEANAQRIVINVMATEKESTTTQEVDYSREQGVELQAEVGFGAKLQGVELGNIKTGGTSIDVGNNSNKYVITLSWTYLTGGLEI